MAFVCRKFPNAQPIVEAYVAATGRPVSYTLQREIAANRIAEAGYAPADVEMVLKTIQHRFEKGMSGYTSMSLSFTNAIEKFERFEDLLLDVRAKLARRKAKTPAPSVPAVVTAVPAPVSEEERLRIQAAVAAQAAEFRRKMRGEG